MKERLFFEPAERRGLGSVRGRSESEGEILDLDDVGQGMYLRTTVSGKRVKALFYVTVGIFALLAARGFELQIVRGESLGAQAEGNRLRTVRANAARGIIFDSTGKALVENAPSFAVSVTGADLPKEAERLEAVSSTLARYGISSEEWTDALETAKGSPYESVAVASRLTHEQAVMLTVESAHLPGISVEVATRRNYIPSGPISTSMSHILGYVGKISPAEYDRLKPEGYHLADRIGKSGLEYSLEEMLRGVPGYKEIEVDALGRERRIVSVEQSKNGENVRLTLDHSAQLALERALENGLRVAKRTRGSAVAIDPRDGGIVAMVSLPAYDPNLFSNGVSSEEYAKLTGDPDRPLFPRATSGQYPSGSVIKPVIAIAALAEGIVTPKTVIMSTGGIWYQKKWFFPDWKAGGHGPTNAIKAIAESVNTFFYTVGGGTENFDGLGPERMADYARRFGMGSKTGVELPAEAPGLIPTPDWKKAAKDQDWYIGDTYHMAIGQGDVLVTPLQIASMTATVANGGTLWRPHFLQSIFDPTSRAWTPIAPSKEKDDTDLVASIETVRQGMRATVTAGSARSLMTLPVAAAGKTGTAQWGTGKPPHAWFTGYAPADDPEIVVTVLIEEGVEGSTAAVPVAKEFLGWYFSPARAASSTP